MNVTSLLESVNRMNSETAHILDVLGENESYLFRNLSAEIESIRKSLMDEQRRLMPPVPDIMPNTRPLAVC